MNYVAVYECEQFRQPSGFAKCYIEDTPKNIAAFIMHAPPNKNYAFITMSDEVKCFSMGNFLDLVCDPLDLKEMRAAIISMQLGEEEIPEVEYIEEKYLYERIPQME